FPHNALTDRYTALIAQTAALTYERDGQPGLVNYLARVERTAGLRARLFDEQGAELSGLDTLPGAQEIARRVAETRAPVFHPPSERFLLAFPATTESGHAYVFVGEFSAPFPPPPLNPWSLIPRILAMLLTAGLLCYLLARFNVALDLARKRAGANATSALDRIEREAQRLNEMIGHLLTLARSESSMAGRPRELVDLAALVGEVVADANFEAGNMNRSVCLTVCEPCRIAGVAPLLRSAVENVVRNAVQYTPEHTVVAVSLRCSVAADREVAVISVRDHGAGVPAEALADIFRPFYRVADARDRESGGTGLGLAITERAVRLHGGSITAANHTAGGFIIEIRLPAMARSVQHVEQTQLEGISSFM